MAALTVGVTAVMLPVDGQLQPWVQNLGPGIVYLDNTSTVTTTTGLKLIVGAIFNFTESIQEHGGAAYLISDTPATNVRYMT
jgi:hypothetical protein